MNEFFRELIDRLADAGRGLYEWAANGFYRLGLRLGPLYQSVSEAFTGYSGQHWKRVIVLGTLGGGALVTGFSGVVFGMYLADRQEIARELDGYRDWLYGRGQQEQRPPIEFFGADGRRIGEYLPRRDSRMTMRACGKLEWLKRAAVSSEDRDFYEHGGVSVRGILRAVVNNVASFSLREGGGTITQQLGRNLFTDRARSFTRKLYETFTAFLIEDKLTKDEILCLYLNKIYMGKGRIGAEEAAWYYFRKPPTELDAAEAAMIVGLFPSPVSYSPQNNIDLSLKKQRLVLETLRRDGFLTEREKNIGLQKFIKRYGISPGPEGDAGEIGLYGASRDFRYNAAPTANDYIKEVLYEKLPEELIQAGGLKVYTTIDPVRQRAALDEIRTKVAAVRADLLKNRKVPPEKMQRIARRMNGVFIAMDSATGDLRAVVGGYAISEGNMTYRVSVMRRQPGSSIKGLLYATAFDEGVLDLGDVVVDEPVRFGGYRPKNWNRKYLGRVPLRKALAMSINTVAVKTLDEVGVSRFRDRMLGTLDIPFSESLKRFPSNLSLALGSGEVSPLELARIYATIENGGRIVYPRIVTRIVNQDGQVIWEDYGRPAEGEAVFSQEACAKTVRLMESVFDPTVDGTVAYIGKRRASNAAYLPFPIAGKTGTVQIVPATRKKFPDMWGVRDAWFVGMVPGEVGVVWLGHDEGAPFQGSGTSTASVWAAYANRALKNRVPAQWPERVREIEVIDPIIEALPEENPESSPGNSEMSPGGDNVHPAGENPDAAAPDEADDSLLDSEPDGAAVPPAPTVPG